MSVKELCEAVGIDAINEAYDKYVKENRIKAEAENKPGIELLKARMRKMGCSEVQLQSKVFANTVIAMAALNDENAIDMGQAYEEIMRQARAYKAVAADEARVARNDEECRREHWRKIVRTENNLKDILTDVQELMEEIFEAETPALRDRMRAAKYYRENITINSCYDNTAYINRLGAILANTTLEDGTEKQEGAKAKKTYYKNDTISKRLEEIKERLVEVEYI